MVPLIQTGLKSDIPYFQKLALKHLHRSSQCSGGPAFVCNHFLDDILQYFFHENISYYQLAYNILIAVLKDQWKLVFSESNVKMFVDNLTSNSIILSRILSLIAETSSLSKELFEFYDTSGLLKKSIEGIDSDDLLLHIDTYERINNVTKSLRGVEYIIRSETYDKLLAKLVDEEVAFSSLILPKVIDVLGDISSRDEKAYIAMETKRPFLDIVHRHIGHEDDEVVVSCLNCFAKVCASTSGLISVMKHEKILKDWMEFTGSSNLDMKIIALSLIAKVIEQDRDETDEILELLKTFYQSISQESDTTELLMRQLKGYSMDLRFSVFSIFSAISKYRWGAEIICSYHDLVEYLLDRTTESLLTGSEWKFAIIQRLWSLENSKKVLGVNNYYMFVEFLKQGVVFQKQQSTALIRDEAI